MSDATAPVPCPSEWRERRSAPYASGVGGPTGEARQDVRSLARIVGDLTLGRAVDAEWSPRLVRAVRYHRVAGAVLASVPPAAVIEPINSAAKTEAFEALAVASATCAVARLLEDADIRVLFYKGVALSAAIGRPITQRPSVDVDCLVDRQDLDRVDTLLRRAGYRPRVRHRRPLVRFETTIECERTYLHERQPAIDVHWAIDVAAGAHTSFEGLWGRSRDVQVGEQWIRTLGAIDGTLATVVHGNRELWSRFRWLVDFGLQRRSLTATDHALLGEAAAAQGCLRALAVACALEGRVTGEPVPYATPASSHRLAQSVLDWGLMQPEPGPPKRRRNRMWKWRTADGDRLRSLAKAVARLPGPPQSSHLADPSWSIRHPNTDVGPAGDTMPQQSGLISATTEAHSRRDARARSTG